MLRNGLYVRLVSAKKLKQDNLVKLQLWVDSGELPGKEVKTNPAQK